MRAHEAVVSSEGSYLIRHSNLAGLERMELSLLLASISISLSSVLLSASASMFPLEVLLPEVPFTGGVALSVSSVSMMELLLAELVLVSGSASRLSAPLTISMNCRTCREGRLERRLTDCDQGGPTYLQSEVKVLVEREEGWVELVH